MGLHPSKFKAKFGRDSRIIYYFVFWLFLKATFKTADMGEILTADYTYAYLGL